MSSVEIIYDAAGERRLDAAARANPVQTLATPPPPDPSALILAKLARDPSALLSLENVAQRTHGDRRKLEVMRLLLCAAGYALPWTPDEQALYQYLVRAGWQVIPKAQAPKVGDLAVYGTMQVSALALVAQEHLQQARWREAGREEWVERAQVESTLLWWLRGPCATCGHRRPGTR